MPVFVAGGKGKSMTNGRESLKSRVYETVLTEISNGTLKANDIVTESALTERFGVSKAPVREALIELCKDQVLQSLPRFGYQVIPYTLSEIMDLLDVRTDIEVANLRRAFTTRPDFSTEILSDASLFLENEEPEISPSYLRNFNFHLRLCSLSHNSFAYSLLEGLLKRYSVFFPVYYAYASRHSTESRSSYHHEIVVALRAGDIDKACSALERDIDSVCYQLREALIMKR